MCVQERTREENTIPVTWRKGTGEKLEDAKMTFA